MPPRRSRRIARRNAGRAGRAVQQQRQAVQNLAPTASFLGVPPEIRRKIYHYVLNFHDFPVPIAQPDVWARRARRRRKRWVSSGLSLLAASRGINEELWDEFMTDWGWLDMSVSTIKLPRDSMMHNRWVGLVPGDLRRFVPMTVRDSVSVIIMHLDTMCSFLEDNDDPDAAPGTVEDVTTFFPAACKPTGRVVVWLSSFQEMKGFVSNDMPHFLCHLMPTLSVLRIGETYSFVFPSIIWFPGVTFYGEVLSRSFNDLKFNLTFEYPVGPRTMQHMIFDDPPGVATVKTMWRKDSYCGRWYTGRK